VEKESQTGGSVNLQCLTDNVTTHQFDQLYKHPIIR